MSQFVNDTLLEEAETLIPELAGTGLDEAMRRNIEANDLEGLWRNIMEARDLLRDE